MSATVEEMREAAALLCDAVPMASPGYGTAMRLADEIRALPVAPVADLAAIEALVVSEKQYAGSAQGDSTSRVLIARVPALIRLVREGEARAERAEALAEQRLADLAASGRLCLAARGELEAMRAQMAEARGLLAPIAAQYDGCDLGSAIGRALAALTREAPASPEPSQPGGSCCAYHGGGGTSLPCQPESPEPTPPDAYPALAGAIWYGDGGHDGIAVTLRDDEEPRAWYIVDGEWKEDPTGADIFRAWALAERARRSP